MKPNQTHPIHCLETSWWLKGLCRLKPDGLHLLRWSGFLEMRRSRKTDCSQTRCIWNSSEPFWVIQYQTQVNIQKHWTWNLGSQGFHPVRTIAWFLHSITSLSPTFDWCPLVSQLKKRNNLELADVGEDWNCTFLKLVPPPPKKNCNGFSLKPETLDHLNFISANL